jgi:hypothetical protein
MVFSDRFFRVVALAALALGASVSFGARAGELAPHRAVYELGKGAVRSGQSVAAVSGTMTLEIDEACEGWSLSQRIRLAITDAMGTDIDSDSRYASFETKDGKFLRFQASDWQDGSLVEETQGTAERDGPDRPGTAAFVKPERQSFELPAGALFPVAFNVELLKRLANGESFASMHGFDGGNLEGAYAITVFIGKERASEWKPPRPKGKAQGKTGGAKTPAPAEAGAGEIDPGGLMGGKVRNVRVAYFPLASQAPEPELEYEMELQPNGVSPVLRLDYQRYQVTARLVALQALPRPQCKQ